MQGGDALLLLLLLLLLLFCRCPHLSPLVFENNCPSCMSFRDSVVHNVQACYLLLCFLLLLVPYWRVVVIAVAGDVLPALFLFSCFLFVKRKDVRMPTTPSLSHTLSLSSSSR
ncbi:MAG: hypothetical protein J3R72DRAFT_451070 [Linnemannia gamsii]|nr:MAG: hypothetical protein J3R72DRAFT_451070 [Linnemannia gamsii]